MKRDLRVQVLLLLSNAIFLLLIGTLSYYNRLAQDDFHFLHNIKQWGIIGSTQYEYGNWGTRWMASLANHSVLTLYQINEKTLFIVGILNLCLFTGGIYLLIENLNKIYSFLADPIIWWKINISLFIVNGIFYSTIRIDETWFWVCATYSYLLSVIMLCWGLAWILHPSKNILLSIIGCMSFVYVGGSCGPLALITLFAFVLFIVAIKTSNSPAFLQLLRTKSNKVILAGIICLLAFIILYLGEGNTIRESYFKDITLIEAIMLNVKTTGMILLLRLPNIVIYLIIFTIPAFYFGHLKKDQKSTKKWRQNIIILSFCYFAIIFLFQLPITYKTQDIGAYRILFPISLISLIYFSSLFYILGKNLELKKGLLVSLLIIPLVLSSGLNSYNLISQKNIVTKYSAAYDERINYLLLNQNTESDIILKPLPPSGMLYSAELSSDSSYFSNLHLKKGLGLRCKSISVQ